MAGKRFWGKNAKEDPSKTPANQKPRDTDDEESTSGGKRIHLSNLARSGSRRLARSVSRALGRDNEATRRREDKKTKSSTKNLAVPTSFDNSEFWLTAGARFDSTLAGPPTGNFGFWNPESHQESAAPPSALPANHETSFEDPRSPPPIRKPGQSPVSALQPKDTNGLVPNRPAEATGTQSVEELATTTTGGDAKEDTQAK